tara:strand:+ start:887 stop:1330 length:444 start_codon:yes stop_codon:yes gene_type:complete
MSSYAPPFNAFAYPFAPVHAACSAQPAPLAACSDHDSVPYKSSVGAAFDTAASSADSAHTLATLEELVLEYVRSLVSKYRTLRDKRRQHPADCDRDSKHLLLQQELALLREIVDLQHDMRELQRQYAGSETLARSTQAICEALLPLL